MPYIVNVAYADSSSVVTPNLSEAVTHFDVWIMSLLFIGMRTQKGKYDWATIQEFYDKNHTWRDIKKTFGCSDGGIFKAIRRNQLKLRSPNEATKLSVLSGRKKHTDETKQKLASVMREFFEKHPEKVGYRMNHSSKKSYPEQTFETALMSSNITGWTYGYNCGIYRYDFAFPDQKIDVEIDGKTHELPNVKKIDARRDLWTKSNGWDVIRFTAKDVRNDVVGCINKLKILLVSKL